VDIDKPRDSILDVTVTDGVISDGRHDVTVVIDNVYDAGTADRLYRVTVFELW